MVLHCVPLFADTVTGQLSVPSAIHISGAWRPDMGPQLGALAMAPKVGYQYTLAGTVLAQDVQHLKQEFLKNTSCKPLLSLGFMIDGRAVLCAVVTPVIHSLIHVCSKLLLSLPAANPIESQVPVLEPAWDKCRISHIH